MSIHDYLSTSFDEHFLREINERHLTPSRFYDSLKEFQDHAGHPVSLEVAGKSLEGRPIYSISAGKGAVKVLLWSQMHGDESTATKALVDILHFLKKTTNESFAQRILSTLTLTMVPMLNPDGAEKCSRRTAQGIDMNRDALAMTTPEARLLGEVAAGVRPDFAFNLHDQELSTVGDTREITALALLAPAFDESGSDNNARKIARNVAASIAQITAPLAPGKIARYDDTFEPRAFGDTFQGRGFSTILIESGHMKRDPVKHAIRRLNFVGILGSLDKIASAHVAGMSTDDYTRLPFNRKRAYDLIIRNVRVDSGGGFFRVDLGISSQVDTHPEGPPRLIDMGDLSPYVGLEEADGSAHSLKLSALKLNQPFDPLQGLAIENPVRSP